MASLGNHSAVLSADATRLYSVLGQAGQRLKKWGSDVKGSVGSALSGIARSAGTGAVAGIASSAATGLLGLISSPFERLNDIAKQGNIAQSLGLTPEAFTGIAGAAKSAGSDTRDFLEGLVTLSARAAEAAEGKGEVAVEMFKKLGLNAAEFQRLNPEQQFYKVFEALNAVSDPALRVQLLLKAFGEDTGKNLVALLGKSTEELKKLAGGFAISSEEMAKAQLANEAVQRANASLGKAFDQLLISMMPVFEWLADKIPVLVDRLMPVFKGFGAGVVTVFKNIAIGVGYFIDVLQAVRGAAGVIVGGLVTLLGHVVDAFASLVGLAKGLPDWMRPSWMDDFIRGTEAAAASLKKVGEETAGRGLERVLSFGETADAARKFFDDLGRDTDRAVRDRARLLANPGGVFGAGAGAGRPEPPIRYEPTAAVLQGSREAAKIEQAFYADAIRAEDTAKKQLEAQRMANELLGDIRDAITDAAGAVGLRLF